MLNHTLKSDVTLRGLELVAQTGRRPWFSKGDKAQMLEETMVPAAVVSEIARRHELPLFTWRQQAPVAGYGSGRVAICTAVVDAMAPTAAVGQERKALRCKAEPDLGGIEVEVDDVAIRAGRSADPTMIAARVHALKAIR